jgi:hypothetical protein
MSRPLSSWAKVPSHMSREDRKEWKEWLEDDKGVDINRGRFTCSGPTSFGAPPDDIDELYERMVKRGVVAGG